MAGLITPYGIKNIKAGCVGVAAVCGAGILYVKWRKKSILKAKARKLKKEEDAAIQAKLEQLQSEDEDERDAILAMSAESLIANAREGKICPVKALNAYLYKACSLTKDLNCVTGLIKDAEAIASSLNASSRSSENCMLYGLPVSLKESLETRGMDSTVGKAGNVGHPAVEDCVIAKVLKHCGAVPFVKTNLSQLMFSFESSNPIFGATVNPQNFNFTPGGSSSGEGSLIRAGGSLLGFGTDTGGSIRCPSHISGISGLMPTQNRISTKGLKGLWGQTGPMARDVDTLVLVMRSLLCPLMFKLDLNVPPLPFNEELFTSTTKLRIGYYLDDGYNKPVPAINRAVNIAKETLEKAGHTLVPFKPPRSADMMRIFTSALFGNGDKSVLEDMKNEEIDPILHSVMKKWGTSRIVCWILSSIIGLKYPRLAQDIHLHGGGDCSVTRLRRIEGDVDSYKQEFHDSWRKSNLDAVICPPYPVVAGPLRSLENAPALMNYTGLYNLLHYPAGVLPVTQVNQEDIEKLKQYKGHYDDPWDWHIKKMCQNSLGISVGVQCVSLPYKDEVCLRVMKEIESLLTC